MSAKHEKAGASRYSRGLTPLRDVASGPPAFQCGSPARNVLGYSTGTMDPSFVLIILSILLVAALYSSVGHGGASGYLAVMALLAVTPEITRPTALMLNVFVATIGTIQFYRAGHFSWRTFWPFAVTSIPFAFIGGMINLPISVYKIVL